MSTTSPNPAPAESIPKPPIDPELPAPLSMGAVMRIPMMRRLWYAQTISVFGDFLALFAVIAILTFKLHATAQQVTGVQIAYMFPIAVLGILAGVFVDRWPLKPTMVASDSIRAVLCLLLLFATQIWHFYTILALISIVSSFFGPAQGVAIRSAVPLLGLRSANALMQQVMFGMRIIGPAIAAFMVALPRSQKLLHLRFRELHRLRQPHRLRGSGQNSPETRPHPRRRRLRHPQGLARHEAGH